MWLETASGPIVGAAIAAGALLGQNYFSNRRADRERWHRERLAAHADLIEELEATERATRSFHHDVVLGRADETTKNAADQGLAEAIRASGRAMARVELLASETTRIAARTVYVAPMAVHQLHYHGLEDIEPRLERIAGLVEKLPELRSTYVEVVRHELGTAEN